jgi:hypothetical protein
LTLKWFWANIYLILLGKQKEVDMTQEIIPSNHAVLPVFYNQRQNHSPYTGMTSGLDLALKALWRIVTFLLHRDFYYFL